MQRDERKENVDMDVNMNEHKPKVIEN